MKKLRFIAVIALLALAGCGPPKVDTAALQGAFQSAPDEIKAELDKGITAINGTNFAAALPPLQKVAYGMKMTKEQRAVMEDTIARVRAHIKK